MKTKKILTVLGITLGSLCSLAACEDDPSESLKEIQINSLYDGMVALYQTKNYSFEIIHTYGSYREEIPDLLFTDNFIGFDGKQADELNGLYYDSTGIYRVSFADDFVSGEYLKDASGTKYTNLWNNDVTYTMLGMGGVYIKKNVTADVNEINITDKDYKLRFMQTIIGAVSDYANVDYLKAKYENNKVIFDLALNNGASVYKVTLKNVGNTVSSHLSMFVKNNGAAFVPNTDLSEMRRLLQKDNFVQRTYSLSDGTGYWSGYQFFTEHYFFLTGSDSSIGYAYMEFDYKESPELDNDFDMWGIYMVNVTRDEDNKIVAGLVSANPYNSSTCEIEECVRYPSRKLKLLENLEYVKTGEVRGADYQMDDSVGHRYYFIEETIVNNFVDNFSLATQFQDVIFNTIAIEVSLAEEDKNSIVCYHAIGYYPADGMTYDIVIPLTGFGDANRVALDYIYNQYNA